MEEIKQGREERRKGGGEGGEKSKEEGKVYVRLSMCVSMCMRERVRSCTRARACACASACPLVGAQTQECGRRHGKRSCRWQKRVAYCVIEDKGKCKLGRREGRQKMRGKQL
eukprot:6181510-Pleurochrysis_carterae.AAC.2